MEAAERQALLRLVKRCGSTPVPAPPGVPLRPASAITGPPASLAGVNLQQARYGTGADPAMITLGPKTGGSAGGTAYAGKTSMEFELPDGTPVLAPFDMRLVGFDNRSAVRRTTPDGPVQSPFDDLELCFRSAAPDWPGLLTCAYHVRSSPLLLGQGLTGACSVVPEWIGTDQAAGHLLFERDDYVRPASARSDESARPQGRPAPPLGAARLLLLLGVLRAGDGVLARSARLPVRVRGLQAARGPARPGLQAPLTRRPRARRCARAPP